MPLRTDACYTAIPGTGLKIPAGPWSGDHPGDFEVYAGDFVVLRTASYPLGCEDEIEHQQDHYTLGRLVCQVKLPDKTESQLVVFVLDRVNRLVFPVFTDLKSIVYAHPAHAPLLRWFVTSRQFDRASLDLLDYMGTAGYLKAGRIEKVLADPSTVLPPRDMLYYRSRFLSQVRLRKAEFDFELSLCDQGYYWRATSSMEISTTTLGCPLCGRPIPAGGTHSLVHLDHWFVDGISRHDKHVHHECAAQKYLSFSAERLLDSFFADYRLLREEVPLVENHAARLGTVMRKDA